MREHRLAPAIHYYIPDSSEYPGSDMPAIEPTAASPEGAAEGELRFPPVTREHILHCSYDYWFPKCVALLAITEAIRHADHDTDTAPPASAPASSL